MARFALIYSGDQSIASRDEQDAMLAEWESWYANMGDAIAEVGDPFGASMHITAAGSTPAVGDGGMPASGYTVIDAESIEAAAAACADHPHLSRGGSIHIFAAIDLH